MTGINKQCIICPRLSKHLSLGTENKAFSDSLENSKMFLSFRPWTDMRIVLETEELKAVNNRSLHKGTHISKKVGTKRTMA